MKRKFEEGVTDVCPYYRINNSPTITTTTTTITTTTTTATITTTNEALSFLSYQLIN
jgi:hypothetical protein